jgi:prolipoprotein diacylglyceryltransferase
MIDPVIFSFKIGSFEFILRWYGVLVMLGVAIGAWFCEREVTHRGEKGEAIWDALIWILPAGIVGARIWYVTNATLGGNQYTCRTRSRFSMFGKADCISMAGCCSGQWPCFSTCATTNWISGYSLMPLRR